MKRPFDLSKLPASFKRQAQIDRMAEAERSVLFPATVEQVGLSEDALGQRRFCEAMHDRREWIATHCGRAHHVEPVRDELLRLVGRRFRFADEDEAFAFKMRFGNSVYSSR